MPQPAQKLARLHDSPTETLPVQLQASYSHRTHSDHILLLNSKSCMCLASHSTQSCLIPYHQLQTVLHILSRSLQHCLQLWHGLLKLNHLPGDLIQSLYKHVFGALTRILIRNRVLCRSKHLH